MRLIITPRGILLDQRREQRYHFINDRRLSGVLRARLTNPDAEPEGGGTFVL